MNRTDASELSPSLIVLGDQDAAACADGVCDVPAADADEPQP
jgi:hypothetical protein